jgi:hypothetical protein
MGFSVSNAEIEIDAVTENKNNVSQTEIHQSLFFFVLKN